MSQTNLSSSKIVESPSIFILRSCIFLLQLILSIQQSIFECYSSLPSHTFLSCTFRIPFTSSCTKCSHFEPLVKCSVLQCILPAIKQGVLRCFPNEFTSSNIVRQFLYQATKELPSHDINYVTKIIFLHFYSPQEIDFFNCKYQ